MITLIFVIALVLALAAVWFFGLDVHRSEGRDADRAADILHWRAKDKRAHFIVAAAIAFVAAFAGVNGFVAWFVTTAAGGALEVMQKNPRDRHTQGGGYASWKDIVADFLGAALGAFLGRALHMLIAYIF